MIPYVRQKKIYDYIKIRQMVYLQELAEYTQVSLPTVRRDVKVLEEEGKILLLNGGGVKLSEQLDHSVTNRLEVNLEEKLLICTKVASYIHHNDVIYLGPGTSENYLIGSLKGKDVTIVTNGIFHARKLVENGINTVIIGGKLENSFSITYGPSVFEEISNMNFSTCVIGASGISKNGVSSFDKDVSIINKKVLEKSKTKILIVDSTKFNKDSPFRFASVEDFDYIFTTDKADIPFDNRENFIISHINRSI
ncbi:MAG: DeoR/GlpR transcriptional regulator [Spirochaetia bacterium]|nr:DeoR/GlpR transcriptional regulator [Spirochaetia bacterium]